MKRPFFMFFFASVALSAASLAADSPPLDQRNTAWAEADAEQLSGLYTEDARVMTPNFPSVVGREKIHAMVTRMMGRNMSIRSTVIENVESGDLWVRRTDYEMVIGEHPVDDGEAVEVWRRVDGRWLLHLEVFTSRNIRPIAYDDPAPEYDRIRVKARRRRRPRRPGGAHVDERYRGLCRAGGRGLGRGRTDRRIRPTGRSRTSGLRISSRCAATKPGATE